MPPLTTISHRHHVYRDASLSPRVASDPAGAEAASLTGVKGVLFDCYNTLIDICTDEERRETYARLSAWLLPRGVSIEPLRLQQEYRCCTAAQMKQCRDSFPEIRIEGIFSDICGRYAVDRIDAIELGGECAREFRESSLIRRRAFPQSIRLLEHLKGLPMGIVSNGQRVFSEGELRRLGLFPYFDVVVFSSDLGVQKPNPRIYRTALDSLGLKPQEVLFVGDSLECDVLGPRKMGMRSLFIHDAWKIPEGHETLSPLPAAGLSKPETPLLPLRSPASYRPA
ncbi:MAG TPA: HAD family hydrolase [Methanomicrobiales archaeon]|nr:HAD family hydrolase [Methanomicrobiales archaeon]